MTDERDEVNESVAQHVRWLRERLEAGRSEIDRQRASVDSTREHITVVREWLEETERLRRGGDRDEAA